jgi:hypothetical protein
MMIRRGAAGSDVMFDAAGPFYSGLMVNKEGLYEISRSV